MAGYDESTYVEGAMIAVAMGKDEKGNDTVLDSFVMEEAAKGEECHFPALQAMKPLYMLRCPYTGCKREGLLGFNMHKDIKE